MQEYRRTVLSLVLVAVAGFGALLAPEAAHSEGSYVLEDGTCCQIETFASAAASAASLMPINGCWDSGIDDCISNGECHSSDPKSCDVGWSECGFVFDEACQ